jgi:hypothetical protein
MNVVAQALSRGGRRFHHNPLHLVNQKPKELAGLLGTHGAQYQGD